MTNSINLIDGLDGLATGVTIIGLLAVSIVSFLSGNLTVTWTQPYLWVVCWAFLFLIVDPHLFFLEIVEVLHLDI